MADLKLIAFDDEDLAIIGAHLQDAVIRVEDMAFLKADRRFALVVNRFDWSLAVKAQSTKTKSGKSKSKSKLERFVRRRAGVRVEHVTGAQVSGIDLQQKDQVLSLLTLTFEPSDAPQGAMLLTFAGGGRIRLDVDCIEAAMTDLGAAWETPRKPEHAGD
jgi:hypothetical protein